MDDRPLFAAATANLVLSARWVYPEGWTLICKRRREGDHDWETLEVYSELATSELIDVLYAVDWFAVFSR